MASANSTKYHTVNVCVNLPKVAKNYPCNEAKDLPPGDYWHKQLGSWDNPTFDRIQHIMANGPCKSYKNFRFINS